MSTGTPVIEPRDRVSRTGRQAAAVARRLPRWLAQHGELHHRLLGERDADAARSAASDWRRPGGAFLSASAHSFLRRARRGIPGEAGLISPASPSATTTSRTTRDLSKSRPMASATLTGRSRRSPAKGVYSIIDLHALPGSQNQHWHSDNPTHVRRSGNTGISGPGRAPVKPSPTTTEVIPGWPDTTC